MNKARRENLKLLFEPRGVAVIGASHNPNKIGYQVVDNIVKGGYRGDIFPVNPKGGKISGLDVYSSIHECVGDVDIAVITIPASHVFDAVKSCAKKKVKYLVIITSGFSEIGNFKEERKIVEYAHENKMRVLGPNIFGLYSSAASLNATFGPQDVKEGNVSIVTQSGAIGIAMIGKTKIENIGLSSIISVGNKSDIEETDILEYLVDDKKTRMILMYIEGIRGGYRLVNALRHATKKKPVVVIKSGRSARGAIAAASHTGSLAGADSVFDDIVKQCGVIRAENIHEALDWCKFLSNSPIPKGENSVIITNGGGIGVLAADACEKYDLHLYDDTNFLKNAFSEAVPEFGSAKNPIDITGAATATDYDKTLDTALNNNKINSVICLGCETAVFDAASFTDVVRKKFEEFQIKKPIVFSIFGGEAVENGMGELKKEGVPVFSDVYEAVSCLGALYTTYRNSEKTSDLSAVTNIDFDTEKIKLVVKKARAEDRRFLFASEAKDIMDIVGVSVPKSKIARNIKEAIHCAEEIGYPVVMKVVSKDILHKSDAGGIALDLQNREEVVAAHESIIHNCRAHVPHAHIEGFEVAEMVEQGIETIAGGRQDFSFGPIVMFGLGGIYVEVMKDVVFRSYPLGQSEVMSMISEIKSYPLLLGVRGEERKDIQEVAKVIMKMGAIIENCPDISDIEVNPLIVYDQGLGVKAVDVRILLK